MQRPIQALQNSLLEALPAGDAALFASHLVQIELERGRLLYDPGDPIDYVYFPHDGVISLMTLMESGAAIESATIGREGGLGMLAAFSPRHSLSRAIVQVPGRASRMSVAALADAVGRSPVLRGLIERHNDALFGHAI